jgi:aspartate-semialdehyde dehydrogenase
LKAPNSWTTRRTESIPTPLDFSKKVKCGVGRIRIDTALDNGLALWVSGDNLWKGAALNAIQNAELMAREGLFRPKSALTSAREAFFTDLASYPE